jgi:hypothetical protein
MPTLFYALLQRLDPSFPICGIHMPRHMSCRIKDRQTGDVYNFEATRGTTARNVWYIERSHIPQKAIDSGIYLRDLTKKEFLSGLIMILVKNYREKNDFVNALKYNDYVLELNPKGANSIVSKCALYAELAYQLDKKRKKEGKLCDKETKLFEEYCSISKEYEERAISLGWQSWTEEDTEDYLQYVKEEKDKRSQQR